MCHSTDAQGKTPSLIRQLPPFSDPKVVISRLPRLPTRIYTLPFASSLGAARRLPLRTAGTLSRHLGAQHFPLRRPFLFFLPCCHSTPRRSSLSSSPFVMYSFRLVRTSSDLQEDTSSFGTLLPRQSEASAEGGRKILAPASFLVPSLSLFRLRRSSYFNYKSMLAQA